MAALRARRFVVSAKSATLSVIFVTSSAAEPRFLMIPLKAWILWEAILRHFPDFGGGTLPEPAAWNSICTAASATDDAFEMASSILLPTSAAVEPISVSIFSMAVMLSGYLFVMAAVLWTIETRCRWRLHLLAVIVAARRAIEKVLGFGFVILLVYPLEVRSRRHPDGSMGCGMIDVRSVRKDPAPRIYSHTS
jgi:hypothetical protein